MQEASPKLSRWLACGEKLEENGRQQCKKALREVEDLSNRSEPLVPLRSTRVNGHVNTYLSRCSKSVSFGTHRFETT